LAAEVGAAEVFGAVRRSAADREGGEVAFAEGGKKRGHGEGGMDGVAGLRVGKRKFEGTTGGDA